MLEEEGLAPEAEPTEDTPLQSSSSSKTNENKVKEGARKLFNITREGPLSFRILAFLGGIGMIVAGLIDIIADSIVTFNPAGLLVALYAFIFGILICAIEGKRFDIPDHIEKTAKFYFRILDYTWGRGGLYAFAGSLLHTQPSKVNVGVGVYMIFVGVVALISSLAAGKKLAEVREALDSKRELRNMFDMHDADGNGSLKPAEFAGLCSDLGVVVSYQELVACFNAIDKNDDDKVTYDEMVAWWRSWGSTKLPRHLGSLMV